MNQFSFLFDPEFQVRVESVESVLETVNPASRAAAGGIEYRGVA